MRIGVNVCVPQNTHDRGHAASRAQAMADFKARWNALV
jgi:hypothetical protein